MSWESNVRVVIPYVPGEQPNETEMIKLNTNECPYPPAAGVEKALNTMDYKKMRLYPDPEARALIKALADYYHIKKEQIFVGVGSDDVLAMSFLTFFQQERPILFPDITYSFYEVWADLFKIPYQKAALDESLCIKKEDYIEHAGKGLYGGIIFPNPNAPTGILESLETIEEIIIANRDVVVIIDEAYIDFGGKSCINLINKYDNILVVQTFSKSRAMAGIRIGYAFGSEKIIKYLNDAKFSFNSYTLNTPSLVCGVKALEDKIYFQEIVGKIIGTRERIKGELKKLDFSFPDSYGNFIFAKHNHVYAKDIYEKLRERKIYVRYFPKDRIDNYLRITIGTDEEMNLLIDALKEILNKGGSHCD